MASHYLFSLPQTWHRVGVAHGQKIWPFAALTISRQRSAWGGAKPHPKQVVSYTRVFVEVRYMTVGRCSIERAAPASAQGKTLAAISFLR